MTKLSKAQQADLLEIAKQTMYAVERRGDLDDRDSYEDYFEVSAWGLRTALERAYLLGKEDAKK